MTFGFNEYTITDVKPEQQIDNIYNLLSDKYMDKKIVKQMVENSICFGVYLEDIQIGFARIISDFNTVYFLCDFIINENHKNKGIEDELLNAITIIDAKFNNLTGITCVTGNDNLFKRYGFIISTIV